MEMPIAIEFYVKQSSLLNTWKEIVMKKLIGITTSQRSVRQKRNQQPGKKENG